MENSNDYTLKNTNKVAKLIFSLVLPLASGGISAYLVRNEMNGGWFTTLAKPSFNPPGYLFGPVWTSLYILMGVSMFLIWNTPKTELRQKALTVFGIQLFFNFWWSILFFSFHTILISVVDILLMWFLIIYMITLFKKIKPAAAYLQIPYLFWVTFATVLNISIWYLNR
ncbi:TspO/MBR family protein [Flavobacterium sp. CG_9.10]|uniref:TspO/MBR family protein n=1 Tax=Flavobacterium sp. CG_9.10 TaxID=2787729 RepID=UPI001E4506C8|nr:TspO/MBR family protein [Flavobacterium sp. CG_9.10]